MNSIDKIFQAPPKLPHDASGAMKLSGNIIRRRRISKKWRQIDLAHKAGVSLHVVRSLENGAAIRMDDWWNILSALGYRQAWWDMFRVPKFDDIEEVSRWIPQEDELFIDGGARRCRHPVGIEDTEPG